MQLKKDTTSPTSVSSRQLRETLSYFSERNHLQLSSPLLNEVRSNGYLARVYQSTPDLFVPERADGRAVDRRCAPSECSSRRHRLTPTLRHCKDQKKLKSFSSLDNMKISFQFFILNFGQFQGYDAKTDNIVFLCEKAEKFVSVFVRYSGRHPEKTPMGCSWWVFGTAVASDEFQLPDRATTNMEKFQSLFELELRKVTQRDFTPL